MRRLRWATLSPLRPARRRRSSGPRVLLLSAAALPLLSGCFLHPGIDPAYNLPEGPDVELAPWPRLADGPAPVPVDGDGGVQRLMARGDAVAAAVGAEAAALMASADALMAEPVAPPSLYTQARALRAKARKLNAEP